MSAAPAGFQLLDSQDIIVAAGSWHILFDPTKSHQVRQRTHRIACISHAHSDHTVGFSSFGQKMATQVTADIHEALGGRPRHVVPVAPGQRVQLGDDCTLVAYPAGHMLGAVQFVAERKGSRLVYTGDFNLAPTLLTEGATPQPCDVLLMEATYGRPGAVFPPRERVYAEIVEWTTHVLKAGKVPTFQVYAVGKAQEIIRLINTSLTVPVVVDDAVGKVSDVYRRHHVPLEYFADRTKEGREAIRQGSYVYVASRRFDRERLPTSQRFARAAATGWAHFYQIRTVDKAFVLSAHADFAELVRYVEEARPKAVYVTCGDRTTFGAVLEKLDVKQLVPEHQSQLDLSDFV
jgi:Cft2 family RNA processing exonuclease